MHVLCCVAHVGLLMLCWFEHSQVIYFCVVWSSNHVCVCSVFLLCGIYVCDVLNSGQTVYDMQRRGHHQAHKAELAEIGECVCV